MFDAFQWVCNFKEEGPVQRLAVATDHCHLDLAVPVATGTSSGRLGCAI